MDDVGTSNEAGLYPGATRRSASFLFVSFISYRFEEDTELTPVVLLPFPVDVVSRHYVRAFGLSRRAVQVV